MNWNLPLFAASAFALMSLTGCDTPRNSSGGMTIMYPTVSEMERYEAQWGMQPRATPARSASAPSTTTGAYVPETSPQQMVASQPAATASPAPVPVETIQPAAPAAAAAPAPAIPPALR